MKHTMLFVAGSSHLATIAGGEAWSRRLIAHHLDAMPRATVLTGDADGPDAWGYLMARERRMRVVQLRCDGTRLEVAPAGALKTAEWSGRCRDIALVHALRRARDAGWDVEALMLDALPPSDAPVDLVWLCRALETSRGMSGNVFVFDPAQPELPRFENGAVTT